MRLLSQARVHFNALPYLPTGGVLGREVIRMLSHYHGTRAAAAAPPNTHAHLSGRCVARRDPSSGGKGVEGNPTHQHTATAIHMPRSSHYRAAGDVYILLLWVTIFIGR